MGRRIHDLKRQAVTPPVTVAILLPSRALLGAVHLARDLLQIAGTLAARSTDVSGSAIFDSMLVADRPRRIPMFGRATLLPDTTIADRRRYDVVIVPPQFAVTAECSTEDRRLSAWLSRQHRQGAFVLSLGGTVLLAKAGLLDGLRATGFGSERGIFSHSFPKVRYMPSQRLVAENRIVTICGIGPIVDGCAHLIEHFHGPQVARRFLRHTSTDALPANEHLALWASALKRHRDPPVLAAQEILEHGLQKLPTMMAIATQVGLGERTLSRRFSAATGLTLRDYVARLRLELADFLLRSSSLPLARVADECGYASASALSRAFAARHDVGPARYRARVRAHAGKSLERSRVPANLAGRPAATDNTPKGLQEHRAAIRNKPLPRTRH